MSDCGRAGLTTARAIDRSIKIHPLARLDAILAALDIVPAASTRQLILDSEPEQVDDWLEKHRLGDRPLVLMHTGGSPRWQSKRWSEDAFRTLAQAHHCMKSITPAHILDQLLRDGMLIDQIAHDQP